MSKHVLSKSSFIRGVQCHKSLYLHKNRYFLRDPLPPEQLAKFRRGTDVGVLARQLFPGGIDCTPPTPFQYSRSVLQTLALIENNTSVIYEAAFIHNAVLVALDILVLKDGEWFAYEVKSSLEISDTFLLDAALQYHVITGTGIELAGISIIRLNKNYVRQGEIELGQLFTIEDVTGEVLSRQDYIANEIQEQLKVAVLPASPAIQVGPHCHRPYPCDFQGHCHKTIPKNSVLDWQWMSLEERYVLVKKKMYLAGDIPEDHFSNPIQQMKWKAHLKNEPFINPEAGKALIDNISYPLFLLKAYYQRPAVPLADGTGPYYHLPIQISVSELVNVDTGTVIEHFYVRSAKNPLEAFCNILSVLQSSTKTFLVYDDTWLKQLIETSLECNKKDGEVNVIDLSEVIRQGFYYHPATNGVMDFLQWKNVFSVETAANHPIFAKDVFAGIDFTNMPDETHAIQVYIKKAEASAEYCIRAMKALLQLF
ncbi:MAG: DUF2779 domain-containing protein [Bacteroidales bacterium]|nr:DUF2779 domain-containing protein [Bacteroidales bacterium]MDZ4205378.1 DUF2779 domain-containing protein [Bacteroidales bacterium]